MLFFLLVSVYPRFAQAGWPSRPAASPTSDGRLAHHGITAALRDFELYMFLHAQKMVVCFHSCLLIRNETKQH